MHNSSSTSTPNNNPPTPMNSNVSGGWCGRCGEGMLKIKSKEKRKKKCNKR